MNNQERAIARKLVLLLLLGLVGCAHNAGGGGSAGLANEGNGSVAEEVAVDTDKSSVINLQAAEERGGEWWLDYSPYDLRRTIEVVQEAYKQPHPVHEDINVWVYTQDFADRFGMPQRWVDTELQGAEALAYRIEQHLERSCGYFGDWDACREVWNYCYLDIYVRSDAAVPWNTDLQTWHRYKPSHSVDMLQHKYGPASGFLSEQAQRDYQYEDSRRGLNTNKFGIDFVAWADDFFWWSGDAYNRGGGDIHLFERGVFEGLDLISFGSYCRFGMSAGTDMEIWFFDEKTKARHFAESWRGSKKLDINYRIIPGADFMRRVERFYDERAEQNSFSNMFEQRYNLKVEE